MYFYPEDDTSGCTMEACQFRDIDETIEAEGADVWGISPDGADSHRRFREKYGLPFTLLSDEDHAVATAYGAWTLKRTTGASTWASSARRSWSIPTAGGLRLAQGQGRRPRRRCPRAADGQAKARPGWPAAAVAGRSRAAKEASLVGGYERSLGRDDSATPCPSDSTNPLTVPRT